MTPTATRRLWRRHGAAALALTGAVILANAVALIGWYRDDPALFVSWLGVGVRRGPIIGYPGWFDPNIGYTTQALGHLCAQDWLHLIIPWWDPFQGVGVPLAAELQNCAFFWPFVLLLHFSSGWLLLRVLKQILAGLFTYVLLVELGLSRLSAFLGGLMFACSATFILLADAPSGALPFLPLLLLGIERARAAAIAGTRLGWSLIAIATAYSFYAGFPETGLLADAFGGVWFAVRLLDLNRAARLRFIGKFSAAVAIGVCLILPGLVPFLQYVRLGSIGGHAHAFATAHLPLAGLPTEFLPEAFGPFAFQVLLWKHASLRTLGDYWQNAGGWIGLLPLVLAIAGLFGSNRALRHIRFLLLSWFLLFEARMFGAPGVTGLFDWLPPIRLIDVVRYAEPTCDFAIIVLAAAGFDHWRRHGFARRPMLIVAALPVSVLAGVMVIAWPRFQAMQRVFPEVASLSDLYVAAMMCLTGLTLYSLSRSANPSRVLLVGAMIILDTLAGFGFSQTAGASRGHLDLGGVAYLHRHLGLQRSYTLGPLAPNYGSRYRIAQINHNLLPVPSLWTGFIKSRLDPYTFPIVFTGIDQYREPGASPAATVLRRNLGAYESVGVAYVLALPGAMPLGPDVEPVFRGPAMWIFRLPHPAPYFSTPAAGACRMVPRTRDALTVTCARSATLIRRELFYPGWHALVNGHAVPVVQTTGAIFQQVALAKGVNRVRFFYRPPRERLACTVALLALLLWLGLLVRARRDAR